MLRIITFLALLIPLHTFSQISANTAGNTRSTAYTNGVANDPVFVFCETQGQLTATPSGGGANLDFYWEKYDPTINGFGALSNELGASTSTINNLDQGGYKVTIYDNSGTTVDCFRAWVFLDTIKVETDTIIPTCQPFNLSGNVTTQDFPYYNAPPHPFLIDASTEITVCFDARHTYVSDLGFYLIGPPSCGSPRIELAPNPGAVNPLDDICNGGDNVNNLCFSTTSTANFYVCDEPAPLTGTWASSDPWNAIFGCDATLGGWRVQIYDCISADVGALTGARITFSGNSDCGPNPTVVTYDSGPINSVINDNSCSAATASIYEVPLTNTTPLVLTNNYTVLWTCSDPSFIISNPTNLNTSVTPTEKRDAWFYLTATDGLGNCEKIDSAFYQYKSANNPVVDTPTPVCNNDLPVNLTAGGASGYWFADGIPDSTVAAFDPTLVTPGYHTIQFEDQDICGGIAFDSILVYDIPSLSIAKTDTICFRDSTELTFNFLTGLSPYDITINNQLGESINFNPVIDSQSAWFKPSATTYYYGSTIIDANGCESDLSDSAYVLVNPTPKINIIGDTTICRGDSALFTFELEGNTNFKIAYSDGFSDDTLPNVSNQHQWYFQPQDSTTYTFGYVVDSSVPQCDTSYNLPVQVNVNPLPTARFSGDTTICSGDTAFIYLKITGVLPLNLSYTDGNNIYIINNILSKDTTLLVNPTEATTYSIVSYQYNDSVSCDIVGGNQVFVDILTPPSASLSGQLQQCVGDTTLLFVNSDGIAPFDITFFNGQTDELITINDLNDGIAVSPNNTTTYILKSLTDNSLTQCPNTEHDSLTLLVNKPPRAQLKALNCNGTATAYEVVIDIFDGNLNYTVDGPPSGNIVFGDTIRFISVEIPTGDPFSFLVDDSNLCGPIEVSGIHACDCISEAGTINTVPLDICVNDTAFITENNDFVLDDNDTINYVLHRGSGSILVDPIDTSASPYFTYDSLKLETETIYYLSRVVGDSLLNKRDSVDLSHICTKVSVGVPVIFHALPSVSMTGDTTICAGQTANLNFNLNGAPPFNVNYLQDGNPANFNLTGSGVTTVGPFNDSITYNLTHVIDNNGCQTPSTDQVVINVNPIPTSTLSTITPSYCYGDSAYLRFTQTGNGPWSIQVFNGLDTISLTNTLKTDSLLVKDTTSTTYSVVQVDDATHPACISNSVSQLTFTVNPIPEALLTGNTAICSGDSTPIFIDASGNGPFILDINTPGGIVSHQTGVNDTIFYVSPNDTSTYSLNRISDNSNPTCVGYNTSEVTIDVNPVPTLDVDVINSVYCEGDSAMFTLHMTADGPYQVNYSAGAINYTLNAIDSAFQFFVKPTQTTNYSFTSITDNDDPLPACRLDTNITIPITVYKRPRVSLGLSSEICEGDTGLIPVSIDGVNPLFQVYYTLNNGAEQVFNNLNETDTIRIPNLPPGNYFYKLTRAIDSSAPINCEQNQNDSVRITVHETPRVSLNGDTTICAGEEVVVSFDFPSGTPNFNLELFDGIQTYSLDNFNSDSIFTFLPTDSTQIVISTLTDRTNAACAGIWDNDTIEVNVNPVPQLTLSGADTICEGDMTYLYFEASGVPNFSYVLTDGTETFFTNPLNTSDSLYVAPENTTTYTVLEMHDGSQKTCSNYDLGEVTIDVRPIPTSTISGENEVCEGRPVNITVENTGVGPFTLEYFDNLGNSYIKNFVGNKEKIAHFPPVGNPITYQLSELKMIDYPYCATSPSDLSGIASFRVDPIPVINLQIENAKDCAPVNLRLINQVDDQFKGSCIWNLGDGRTLKSCEEFIENIIYTEEGSYDISLSITSPLATRCHNDSLIPEAVVVYPKPDPNFNYTPKPATLEENSVQFINLSVNAETYTWKIFDESGLLINHSNQENLNYSFPNEDEADYPVRLIAESIHGCIDSTDKVVSIQGVMLVNIPNSFTPNEDGVNDYFVPIIYGAATDEDFSFKIFNQWGEEIYSVNYYDPSTIKWDGKVNNKVVQSGTYVYKLVVKSKYNHKIKTFHGEFNLMR